MKKIRIRREDVLMGLDGALYIEGKSKAELAKSVKKNKRTALNLLRKMSPKLQAKDITIDKQGRVKIMNTKISQVAQAIAADKGIKEIGKVIGGKPAPAPSDDRDNEVNFICPGDGSIDLICGSWTPDSDDPCNANFVCHWS
jgi:hypothetical protein